MPEMIHKIKRLVQSVKHRLNHSKTGNPKIILRLIPIIAFLFLGWGYIGHSIINYNTILSALPQMSFFANWADSLAAHASDADYRKSTDPNEGPKHYIDIDNYPEFLSTGAISQNFDSLVALHGYSFVLDQGILPWAILNTADSIQAAFQINNLNKAMLLAADLGHYIADSHMPLHLTRNYNGQYTGQTGVHSRYESNLIQRFQNQIIYGGDSLQYIDNLPDFIFNMIYENYLYVDSVLAADAAAKVFAGSTSSTAYYNKFWEIAKYFTIELFRKASYKLTCVIYTAWINAGGTVNITNENEITLPSDFHLSQNYPNPFNPGTVISWQSPVGGLHTLKVYDVLGNEMETLVDEYKDAGSYKVVFGKQNLELSSGIYFYQLIVYNSSTAMPAGKQSPGQVYAETKKMLLLK